MPVPLSGGIPADDTRFGALCSGAPGHLSETRGDKIQAFVSTSLYNTIDTE